MNKKLGEPTRPVECPLPLDAGVDRQTLACGQLGVDARRVDASRAELLLDLAERDALPYLVDGCPVAEIASLFLQLRSACSPEEGMPKWGR